MDFMMYVDMVVEAETQDEAEECARQGSVDDVEELLAPLDGDLDKIWVEGDAQKIEEGGDP
jgi:hypothetical protein